ncbi:EpsG family protein [Paraburkholderia sediminicola]|uniref:EpsG family protein n=1 Tax=Paraburkholderia sediminicola TaxID=458836 RepID=UPI0038B86157
MTKTVSMPHSANSDPTGYEAPTRELFKTPGGWAFVLISSLVLYLLATTERPPTLPDQWSYLAYFQVTDWQWIVDYYSQSTSAVSLAVGLVTEELGWRAWILLVNSFGVTPEMGIRVTVVIINALVFCSLSRLSRPLLGLALWFVIPAALAIVGLFQIRQGFAFAIAMLFAINFRRPVLGALIASTIHTTFAIPAILLIVARLSGDRQKIALPAVSLAGILLASMGGLLFKDYGGRRIDNYAGYQAEFSARLLVLVITYGVASAMLLYQLKPVEDSRLKPLRELATMHIGLIVYLIAAFFVFPFGKDRVFYYVSLLLPYFFQVLRVRTPASLWFLLVLLVTMSAEIVLANAKGAYSVILYY